MQAGLRPGELYGLCGHRVDWLRGTLQVVGVMTRNGLRQWPRPASDLQDQLSQESQASGPGGHVLGTGPGVSR